MNVLITGGGCEEPIDNVRFIANFSTGKTSSFIADFLMEKGCNVTCVMAEKAVKPKGNAKIIQFRTFSQLNDALKNECQSKKYDAVIHAAAVSDYSPDKIIIDGKEYNAGEYSKVPSGSELVITMKKNPKILDSIKGWCGKETKVFGFKLTSNASVEDRKTAVEKVFLSNKKIELSPDFVISNDLSEIEGQNHPCVVYNRKLEEAFRVSNLEELAFCIYNVMCTTKK